MGIVRDSGMGKRHFGVRSLFTAALLACLLGAAGPIPAPWTETEIGAPGQAGSATWDPVTDVWAVSGGGGDIWDTVDHFHFVSRAFSGDCELTTQVLTQSNTNVWAKCGVMIRETTAGGSTFALAATTPGNGIITQWRTTTDGGAAWPGSSMGGTVPMWVRLNRTGNVFTGYASTDGAAWTQTGQVTITMAASVQVGLAVTAHDNNLRSDCTFSNFTLKDGTGTVVWPLAPPTGLTATNSINSVTLNWTASASASTTGYSILRGTTNGGPYTALPGGTTNGLTFTDTTAANPGTFYYVVIATNATEQSMYSNQATGVPLPPAVTVSPLGPITTSESGTTAILTLTINNVPSATATIQITSNNPSQAIVSGQGNGDASVLGPAASITITINAGTAATTTFPITVHGVRDFIDNGNQPYAISFTVNGGGWPATTIPTVNGTNMDIDTAALLVSPTGGLITDTNGATAQFSVQLNTIPLSGGVVTVTLTSSDPTEGTVNPPQIQFTAANYNTPVPVTLTGQGTNLTYQNAAYTVTVAVTATTEAPTASYNTSMVVPVSALNLHREVPPELPHVWGGKSSGGGCGLTGLEAVILLGLGAAWRRRRRS
jgi:regulation of enolase protein 1 (concanavalin A-like superfamily)